MHACSYAAPFTAERSSQRASSGAMLLDRRAACVFASLCISSKFSAPALAAGWVDSEKEAATLAACVKDLSCARRREADKAIAAERRRARELEMLEDEGLERCRFAGKQNFEQCFFYGSDSPEIPDAAAPAEPASEKSRRAPPTW